jgi:hypothetical protein
MVDTVGLEDNELDELIQFFGGFTNLNKSGCRSKRVDVQEFV